MQPEKTGHILHMNTRKKTAEKNDEGKLDGVYSKKTTKKKLL